MREKNDCTPKEKSKLEWANEVMDAATNLSLREGENSHQAGADTIHLSAELLFRLGTGEFVMVLIQKLWQSGSNEVRGF